MYLSNAEKEALQLTGYGDAPPWAVAQGLEQALAKGTYIPGEEALRVRLADALDLEKRLAQQRAEELRESGDVAIGDLAFVAAYNNERFRQVLVESIEASQEAAATEGAATEGQEAAEGPPAGRWRSPLEIVTEGAEEAEQEAPGEEDAAPAAAAQRIEDRDFSSFTKTQLVNFAQDYFGVELKRTVPRDELIDTVQGLVDEANEKAV